MTLQVTNHQLRAIFTMIITIVPDAKEETRIILETPDFTEYLDAEVKEIDFTQRTLILSTIFEHLLVKVEFLPFDVKQVVLARMLEGKFLGNCT